MDRKQILKSILEYKLGRTDLKEMLSEKWPLFFIATLRDGIYYDKDHNRISKEFLDKLSSKNTTVIVKKIVKGKISDEEPSNQGR